MDFIRLEEQLLENLITTTENEIKMCNKMRLQLNGEARVVVTQLGNENSIARSNPRLCESNYEDDIPLIRYVKKRFKTQGSNEEKTFSCKRCKLVCSYENTQKDAKNSGGFLTHIPALVEKIGDCVEIRLNLGDIDLPQAVSTGKVWVSRTTDNETNESNDVWTGSDGNDGLNILPLEGANISETENATRALENINNNNCDNYGKTVPCANLKKARKLKETKNYESHEPPRKRVRSSGTKTTQNETEKSDIAKFIEQFSYLESDTPIRLPSPAQSTPNSQRVTSTTEFNGAELHNNYVCLNPSNNNNDTHVYSSFYGVEDQELQSAIDNIIFEETEPNDASIPPQTTITENNFSMLSPMESLVYTVKTENFFSSHCKSTKERIQILTNPKITEAPNIDNPDKETVTEKGMEQSGNCRLPENTYLEYVPAEYSQNANAIMDELSEMQNISNVSQDVPHYECSQSTDNSSSQNENDESDIEGLPTLIPLDSIRNFSNSLMNLFVDNLGEDQTEDSSKESVHEGADVNTAFYPINDADKVESQSDFEDDIISLTTSSLTSDDDNPCTDYSFRMNQNIGAAGSTNGEKSLNTEPMPAKTKPDKDSFKQLKKYKIPRIQKKSSE